MIRVIDSRFEDPRPLLARRGVGYDEEVSRVVAEIIADVRERGDQALLDNARRFDSPGLKALLASPQEIDEAMPPAHHAFAIDHAIERVKGFHETQLAVLTTGWKQEDFKSPETRRQIGQPRHHMGSHRWNWSMAEDGILGQRMAPIQRAGIYVPGGKASYPSSVVMNVVPAQVAGVDHVSIATPARTDGSLSPATLYAARYCGVAQILKVGGAAAIAAFAFGTETVSKVDKIAGPGNRYVNEAKRQVWGSVGLDGYAGPSEVCVLIDDSSNSRFAAADFLTQIEHAEDNAGFLIGTSEAKVRETLAEIDRQATGAPREAILRKAMADYGMAIIARDLDEACELANLIAPEHISIATRTPDRVAAKIENAGCLLLGEWTPESAGDYCAGPSHTLPTSKAARFGSPLSVTDFLKLQSVVQLNRQDLEELSETIAAFGEMEGLPTHARGSAIRNEGI